MTIARSRATESSSRAEARRKTGESLVAFAADAARTTRRWVSPVASALLFAHLVGMALAGFTRGHWTVVTYVATLLGLIAIPICSWLIARRIDQSISRRSWRPTARATLRLVLGLLFISLPPAVFRALYDAPLPIIGRVLEMATALLSIAVFSGLVLVGLGLADLVYQLTTHFRHLSTRLMTLVSVTALGTFLWLSFVGLQVRALLLWAIEQGQLQPYVKGLAYLERTASAYVGGLAGAIGLQLPLILLLAWRFGRNATAALTELRRGFDRVAHGDLTQEVAVQGNDEVAEMQRGFNAMLAAARERRLLENAFGRYVSPVVLDRIRKEGGVHLVAERRVATVMFSDIRGFTSLAANLAPEDVVALMNSYMSLMIETIARYDGYINKFVGDAIMVVFNAPIDQPNHALRALCCAMAMQRNLERANRRQLFGQHALQMGIGINSGLLVAGNLGNERQMEFTVLGDTVNVASRAVSTAEPGQVVVTASVLQQARDVVGAEAAGIEADSLGAVELKNRGEIELFVVRHLSDLLTARMLTGRTG